MCSSVLGTEVTQPDRSLVTSVLGQIGPQKKTEVTEDRSDQGPKWTYPDRPMNIERSAANIKRTMPQPDSLRLLHSTLTELI